MSTASPAISRIRIFDRAASVSSLSQSALASNQGAYICRYHGLTSDYVIGKSRDAKDGLQQTHDIRTSHHQRTPKHHPPCSLSALSVVFLSALRSRCVPLRSAPLCSAAPTAPDLPGPPTTSSTVSGPLSSTTLPPPVVSHPIDPIETQVKVSANPDNI